MVAGRVYADRRTGWLVVGDLVLIALFVGLGEVRHGGGVIDWAITFGEFGLAWLVIAVSLGVYGPRGDRSPRDTGGLILVTWVVAAILGWAFRATVEPFATFSFVFLLVMIGTGLLVLLPWRVFVAPRVLSG